ncbi:MAG TPA: DUF2461 family protein [Anaerolineae bacterium]|jgi:hypothetical protein|nr:DUF2461 family protein [Anaerolineae bacterium]
MIDRNPEKFLKATSFFSNQMLFVIEGEVYKRILDESKPKVCHVKDILQWYQRRNLYLACNRGIDAQLFSDSLIEDLISGFELISPLYNYLGELSSKEDY